MTRINVTYSPGHNGELDDEITLVAGHLPVSSGYFIPTGERDMQFDVPDETADDIVAKLEAMGVRAVKETA